MTRTAVVTGIGTTSPVGGDVASTWDALLAGTSGVDMLTYDWAEELGTRFAAEAHIDPTLVLERVKARRLDRSDCPARPTCQPVAPSPTCWR